MNISFKEFLKLREDGAVATPAPSPVAPQASTSSTPANSNLSAQVQSLQGKINDLQRRKTQVAQPFDHQISQLQLQLMNLSKQLAAQQSQQAQTTAQQQTAQQQPPAQQGPAGQGTTAPAGTSSM